MIPRPAGSSAPTGPAVEARYVTTVAAESMAAPEFHEISGRSS